MKVIEFKEDYKKLEEKQFLTLRNKDKHIFKNEIVCIKTPTKEFKVKCTSNASTVFKNIPTGILELALEFPETEMRLTIHEQALALMHEFYKGLTMNSQIFIYWFEKCEE